MAVASPILEEKQPNYFQYSAAPETAINAFLSIVYVGRTIKAIPSVNGPFVMVSDSWKSLEASLGGCSRMSKELQLLAGIPGCQVQHMAGRCLVPNQANGSKMVRGTAEGTRSITRMELSTFLQRVERQLFNFFLTVYHIGMFQKQIT